MTATPTPQPAATPPKAPPPPRAIILAAGRGERMRPLTDSTPKPLLPVLGRPLIEWHLLALARDGVREVLINTAWLEDQFEPLLGDGSRFGLHIQYSHEGQAYGGALETAGGIATALPRLYPQGAGEADAFWLISADIWAPDFHFDPALAARFASQLVTPSLDAHLWLVPNPPFHPRGDFAPGAPLPALAPDAYIGQPVGQPVDQAPAGSAQTYANLALMRPRLLAGVPSGTRAALGPLLHQAMAQGKISVQMYPGRWENVGTPQQWADLQKPLSP